MHFELKLELTVKGLIAYVRDGRLTGVSGGQCSTTVTFACEGVTIAKRTVDLGRSLFSGDFGRGIPLVREDESRDGPAQDPGTDRTPDTRGPGLPPGIQPHAGPPSVPRWALAGFGIRFLGAVIDLLVLLALTAALGNGFVNATVQLFLSLTLLYFTIGHGSRRGQTVGTRLVGIRVVDARDGGRIPYWRALVRCLASLTFVFAMGLGYLWMLWDDRNQTWHDKAGRTLVVPIRFYPPRPQAQVGFRHEPEGGR